MSYLLQPDLRQVENPAVPPNRATDDVFVYPQPSTQNHCCRPNTMLYGTAPYMAGKGAPEQFVDVADELRPQSTSQFKKPLVRTYEKNYFPLQKMHCSVPLRTLSYEPASTRAELQNSLYIGRY